MSTLPSLLPEFRVQKAHAQQDEGDRHGQFILLPLGSSLPVDVVLPSKGYPGGCGGVYSPNTHIELPDVQHLVDMGLHIHQIKNPSELGLSEPNVVFNGYPEGDPAGGRLSYFASDPTPEQDRVMLDIFFRIQFPHPNPIYFNPDDPDVSFEKINLPHAGPSILITHSSGGTVWFIANGILHGMTINYDTAPNLTINQAMTHLSFGSTRK